MSVETLILVAVCLGLALVECVLARELRYAYRGARVAAFVHPRRPHLVALRPGASALAVAMAIFVLCFLVLAVIHVAGRQP